MRVKYDRESSKTKWGGVARVFSEIVLVEIERFLLVRASTFSPPEISCCV